MKKLTLIFISIAMLTFGNVAPGKTKGSSHGSSGAFAGLATCYPHYFTKDRIDKHGKKIKGGKPTCDLALADPNSAKKDHSWGGRRMADGSTYDPRINNGDGHCAVKVDRRGLQHHSLKVCVSGRSDNCLVCYVTDNGPRVKGVDLTPMDWNRLPPTGDSGEKRITIADMGNGDFRSWGKFMGPKKNAHMGLVNELAFKAFDQQGLSQYGNGGSSASSSSGK